MWLLYTNRPRQVVDWTNESSYVTGNGVLASGMTIGDGWWWSLNSFEEAILLRYALRQENKGKHMKLYLKQVNTIPPGWQ